MRIIINKCWGGFGLSPRAVKRWAKLKGRKCYFYTDARDKKGNPDFRKRIPISMTQASSPDCFMWYAYDIPNADEILGDEHYISTGGIDRADPDLVRVVEELGRKADGNCAELHIVEIPDGIEYEINEYDGQEFIEEVHRSWG